MDDDHIMIPVDPDAASLESATAVVTPARRGQHGYARARPGMLAAIGAGGMLGASARYGIARALPPTGGTFPWATFWTNISGSFLLGALLILMLERFPPTRYARPFVATGVIGAFTTMSTYQVETALLIRSHHVVLAIVYSTASVVCGLVVADLGMLAGRLKRTRHKEARR
jgi:CrcB protein